MNKPQMVRQELSLHKAAANQAKRIAARKAKHALVSPLDLSKFF